MPFKIDLNDITSKVLLFNTYKISKSFQPHFATNFRKNMSRCRDDTDCYFYQECQDDPSGGYGCLGFCVLAEWFWWKIGLLVVGVIGGIIACIRCKHCLLHKWFTQGKCWKKHEQIEESKFAKTNLLRTKALSQDRIATFQDVMLVRSISMGKG